MKRNESRRKFLGNAAFGIGAVALGSNAATLGSALNDSKLAQVTEVRSTASTHRATPPLVIASANGVAAVTKAVEVLRTGGDTLDAVIAGVNIVELDPKDNSVGYGGLPNERGDVELDASVMHGPTRRAGAVAAIRGVKTPSKVAKMVLERTDHILLVGQGAREFATAHGFEDVNLLTEESRIAWLRWKETLSDTDKWGRASTRPRPLHLPEHARLREMGCLKVLCSRKPMPPEMRGGKRNYSDGLMKWRDARRQGRLIASRSINLLTSVA
jgi:N4-(beta-N-acetylglucosaminyl)-L-asparaginase